MATSTAGTLSLEPPAPRPDAGLWPALAAIGIACALVAWRGLLGGAGQVDPRLVAAVAFVLAASFVVGRFLRRFGVPEVTSWVVTGVLAGPVVAALLPTAARPGPLVAGYLGPAVLDRLAPLAEGAFWLAVFGGAQEAGRGAGSGGPLRGLALPAAHAVAAAAVTGAAAAVLAARPFGGALLPESLGPGAALWLGAPLLAASPAVIARVVQDARAEGTASRLLVRASVVQLLAFAAVAAALGLGDTGGLRGLGLAAVAGAALGAVVGPALSRLPRGRALAVAGVVLGAGAAADGLGVPPIPLLAIAGFGSAFAGRGGARLAAAFQDVAPLALWVALTLLGALLVPLSGAPLTVAALAGTLWLVRLVALAGAAAAAARVARVDDVFARHGWAAGLPRAELAAAFGAALALDARPDAALAGQVVLAMVALDLIVGPRALVFLLQAADEGPDLTGALGAVVGRLPTDGRTSFGPPPALASERLVRELQDVRYDVDRVLGDVRAQLLEPFREDAEAFVRELRREFLRHHRRVTVQARTAAGAELANELRVQQGELADRWRGLVLAREATAGRSRWSAAGFLDALDRAADAMPEWVTAPVEDHTYRPRPGERWPRRVARLLLRRRRDARRWLGLAPPTRRVPLRALVRHHLTLHGVHGLEATLAGVVSAQAELVGRTRSLFDSIAQGYDAVAAADAPDARGRLEALRRDVEEELAFVGSEAMRCETEGTARATAALGAAYQRTVEDAARVGTIDLPTRERTDPRPVRRHRRYGEGVANRFEAWRRVGAAELGLLALDLDLVGLEARLKEVLARTVDELAGDVRGRGAVQAERVEAALAEARDHLTGLLAEERPGGEVAAAVRERTDAVEKTVREAAREAVRLRDQLRKESTVAPFLDGLRRAALSLAERYTVPAAPPGRGAWQLPPPPATLQVPFRDVVAAHVETAVAPRLLAVVRGLSAEVEPLVASLAELERRLAFNVELATADLEAQPEAPATDAVRALLEEMVGATLERNRELLAGHARAADAWPDTLRARVAEAVLGSVRELRRRFLDGDLGELRGQFLRQAAGRRLVRRAEALPDLLSQGREDAGRALRRVVGEDRLDAARRFLGLPLAEALADPSVFAPPRSSERLPLVYRRLFSPESLEAGDVLMGREPEIERGIAALAGGDGRARSVALVGLDGVGKGAVASAVVRGTRFKQARRVVLEAPTDAADAVELLQPRGSGQLTLVGGLHWLVRPGPGGFDGIRRFAELLVRDGGQNAFVIQVDAVVWTYLDGVAGLGTIVTDAVELAPLDAEALRAAVLARHRLSGLGLSFDPGGVRGGLEEALTRLAARLRRPYDSYFRRLHVASGGLVRDALRLWLASIASIDAKADVVHVGAVPSSPLPALRTLPEDILVALAAVLRHGWLDADGYAHLFRTDAIAAEARLARLARWGLLVRGAGFYRVAVHLRGPLHKALVERGWVR